jgi:glucose uptake protein GlcU
LVFSIIGADNAHCLTTTYKLPPTTSTTDFQMLLVNLLHWMLSVIGPIALIMLIIAGMMHITSAGDPQKAASAKKVYMAMAGLIIALLSYSMLVLLNNMFT